MALTREEILNRKTRGRETVELPGGGEVIVRGLSRDEAAGTAERDGVNARDNYVISCGLVDPELSEDDVAVWAAQEGSAGDLHTISEAISRLSRMTQGAGKSGVAGAGKRS